MAKKKTTGQFDNYKKWKSDEGCIFLARDKDDAKLYLKKYTRSPNFGFTEVTS